MKLVDWSVGRRLQRESEQSAKRSSLLQAPQERSDEEIEVMPAESVRPNANTIYSTE